MGMESKSRWACDGCCTSTGPHGWSKKIFWALMCVALVFGIFLIESRAEYEQRRAAQVGIADRAVPTFTVSGFGKVTGTNDIAMTTIGFTNTDKDVATAQANNKKVMDQVMADLKKLGIEDRDLQTDYSIYPDYDYPADKGQQLKGYKVSQSVTVKIRKLDKIPSVLALAGKYGANEVGGLSFTIDDAENLRAEARVKALASAKEKAQKLADSLGMRIVEVINYSEYEGGGDDYQMLRNVAPVAEGVGGLSAPTVSSGSTDVQMTVNLTYEIVRK